ncbi:MAG: glycyl-radical enzyme activating protein [Deltaproteobacteria bacterium]|nr:glycyl-radical enzyme activating protein [Deltaproteobacteria bacterium]MBW2659011.1 glycyl-radical enzyme activating protein [Deltaproteobacteria bacterium]
METGNKGVILCLERTSIHDGQGLRVVLFMKGCSLSCKWCSTPESQNAVVEKGYGRIITVDQAVAEICKDEIFFFHSGGGVTVSGGECLLQPDFVAGVLGECRRRGIDTAVETSLFAPWQNVEKILPLLNTIFVDLKHPNGKIHKNLVGADNSVILANLKRIDQSDFPVQLHLRIPLIPGINDGDEVLSEALSIANSLKKLVEIEILPYHRLGVGTYAKLERSYELEDVKTPSREYIVGRKEFLEKQGSNIRIKVGGGCTAGG